jgi:hypothetical protein
MSKRPRETKSAKQPSAKPLIFSPSSSRQGKGEAVNSNRIKHFNTLGNMHVRLQSQINQPEEEEYY